MPRRVSDRGIGSQRHTDQHNAVRTVRLERRDRGIDLGQRLIIGRVIAAVERPWHFRRRPQRALFFPSAQDAATERPPPAALSMKIEKAPSASISGAFAAGKITPAK